MNSFIHDIKFQKTIFKFAFFVKFALPSKWGLLVNFVKCM